MNAGRPVVAASLRTHAAISDAQTILATRRITTTNRSDHSAVLRIGLEVDALPVEQREAGFASTLAIVAILVVALALRIAGTATIGVALRIAAVVPSAIGQTANASA